ncbi:MAG: amidohydrolase [Eggerthellales bacterium]|nr:amidohydrolase [Eggerthellales bacterium]
MLFENIAILDQNLDYLEGQFVATAADGTIAYVGPQAPADYEGETYDGAGKLLIPALYNAHAHAPMTLLRGYAENAPLQEWLNDLVWPYEAKMTPEDNYWATLLSCAEMARYGCVSFSDMYYHTPERAQAVAESGLKANLCTSPIAFEPKGIREFPIFAEMEEGAAKYHGSENGRIRFDACVHAEYTNNDVTTKSVVDWAKEKGLGMQIHLSETKSEVEECKQRHNGMSPVEWFNSLGAFDIPLTAAHCVWVDENDIRILAEKGVSVAHNPASNMKLASGFAPIAAMMDAGVNVCLGTDGMASNNNHDMFQDMYLAALLPKGNLLDPAVITPKQIFAAATRNGALAQGRTDCGLIKEGFRADLAVLDVTGPSWTPMTDPLCNLVYAGHGSDVVLTMCDGQVVYQDGTWPTIDLEQAKAQVIARHQRICGQLANPED